MRRLRRVQAHVCSGSGRTAVTPCSERAAAADLAFVRPGRSPGHAQSGTGTVSPLDPPTTAVSQALSAGRQDISALSPEAITALMRPEPDLPSETEASMASLGAPRTPGIDPLWDRSSGSGEVSAAQIARVHELQQAAIESRDFELAQQYESVIACFSPRDAPLTMADVAPRSVEEAAAFFFNNGFVAVENVLEGEALATVQSAWMALQEPVVAEWQAAREHGVGINRHGFKEMADGYPAVGRKTTGLDIAELARRAPAVLDVIDGPIVSSLAKRLVIGPEDYDYDYYMGDPRCVSFGALIYPPDADAAGYTYWHRDTPPTDRWPHPRARFIKMFVNVFDVEPHGGPLSVVPGSHRLIDNPWELFGASFRSSLTLDAELPQEAMPNHFRFASKAGSALLFDTSIWHTPFPNTSGVARRTITAGWASTINGQMVQAGTPTGGMAELREAVPERFTPKLCALFGLEDF